MDQFGNVTNVIRYGVDSVLPDHAWPRKCRPYDVIALVHAGEDRPVLEDGNWGMHLPDHHGITTNARDDRLESSPLWKSMWGHEGGHVMIPVSHGYEMTKRTGEKVWSCIQRSDDEPWFIAGLGREQEGKRRTEWHVSMVTTDAGPVFAPIHDTPREVVCLRDWDEVQTWLSADVDACRDLIRPATPDVLSTHRVNPDVLTSGFPVGKWPEPWDPPKQAGLDAF